jgi:hypothetical protein
MGSPGGSLQTRMGGIYTFILVDEGMMGNRPNRWCSVQIVVDVSAGHVFLFMCAKGFVGEVEQIRSIPYSYCQGKVGERDGSFVPYPTDSDTIPNIRQRQCSSAIDSEPTTPLSHTNHATNTTASVTNTTTTTTHITLSHSVPPSA